MRAALLNSLHISIYYLSPTIDYIKCNRTYSLSATLDTSPWNTSHQPTKEGNIWHTPNLKFGAWFLPKSITYYLKKCNQTY